MFLKGVKFVISAPNSNSYPKDNLNELVILGRSNVGKSTFLNRLTNNKNLAKTSSTPGRTRLLNFFDVNNEYRIVDAPGYGYQVGNYDSDEQFAKMMEEYIATRSNLKGALLLLDSRRVPSENDIDMLNYLVHYSIPFTIIATKCDKLNQSERTKLSNKLLTALSLPLTTNVIRTTTMKDDWQDKVIDAINYYVK